MATRAEIGAVYAAGVIQGIILVTFPAVSVIFTSPAHYALSTTEYGGMFAPQAVTAILASLLGAGLARKIGGKRVFLIGLAADLVSMALLFGSQFVAAEHSLAYALLLGATAALGVGFGFVVPALNTFTAAFFPATVDRAILTLNALLGAGTALAPVFAAIFVGLGFWWGLPLLMLVLAAALFIFSAPLPFGNKISPTRPVRKEAYGLDPINRLVESGDISPTSFQQPTSGATLGQTAAERVAASAAESQPVNRVEGTPSVPATIPNTISSSSGIPARFWVYAAFALLYGICETLSGNWATVYMDRNLGASATLASLALTAFWGAVTAGRVLFAAIGKWVPERWTYRGLPVLLAVAFGTVVAAGASGSPIAGVLAFGLAGLGCSALLPLVISFAQAELTSMGAAVAGGMIGFYMTGYGIAAFGVGPLQAELGLTLGGIYRGAVLGALVLAAIAFVIVGRRR